jgi:hypothetical protein
VVAAVCAAAPAHAATDGQLKASLVSTQAGWRLSGQTGTGKAAAPVCDFDKQYRFRMCSRFWDSTTKDATVPWFASVGTATSPRAAIAALDKVKHGKSSDPFTVVSSTPTSFLIVGPWSGTESDIAAGVRVDGAALSTVSCYGPRKQRAAVITCAQKLLEAQGLQASRTLGR